MSAFSNQDYLNLYNFLVSNGANTPFPFVSEDLQNIYYALLQWQSSISGVKQTTFAATPNLLFDRDYAFGGESTPQSPANISADYTGAKVGQCCLCIINKSAEPTYGAGIEKLSGSMVFDAAVNNYFLFTYKGNNKAMLTIFR